MADHVKVTHVAGEGADGDGGYGAAVLQWDAGPLADCVADAVVSVLLQEQGKPAAVGAAEEARKCAPPLPFLPASFWLRLAPPTVLRQSQRVQTNTAKQSLTKHRSHGQRQRNSPHTHRPACPIILAMRVLAMG